MPLEYAGGGDPARSLALLWRSRSAESESRSGLSVQRVIDAAIELADEGGLEGLSMRRLGTKLGVGTTSLYTYVPGKAELIDAMLDSAHGELTADPWPQGLGWRQALEQMARRHFDLYRRHAWMLEVASGRPPLGPGTLAKYERALLTIAEIGLDDIEMDSVVKLLEGHVEGAARHAVEEAQAQEQTGMSDEQWWRAHEPILGRLLDPDRFPTASRVGSAAGEAFNAPANAQHAFEFGLQRILDGVEAFLRKREPPG